MAYTSVEADRKHISTSRMSPGLSEVGGELLQLNKPWELARNGVTHEARTVQYADPGTD